MILIRLKRQIRFEKIVISLLITAQFHLLFGCQSSKLVSVNEYNQIEKEDKPKEIQVITKDGQKYHFSNSNFYIANDTLYGKEQLIINEKWIPFDGKIAFNEIKEVEYYNNKNDWTYTLSISEYKKIEVENGKPVEIFLIKTDSTKYYFNRNDYYLNSDTLIGKGKLLLYEREQRLTKSIALSNIETIEFEYVTATNRIFRGVVFLSIVLLGLLILLVGYLYFSHWEW